MKIVRKSAAWSHELPSLDLVLQKVSVKGIKVHAFLLYIGLDMSLANSQGCVKLSSKFVKSLPDSKFFPSPNASALKPVQFLLNKYTQM